ncbi:hypothetical protein BpHYR1_045774 [Brachionus plicatilis]|uniref:Uncharacterized protein n=1 Tax=Brachionus plicatilis TaxID=10195 RepID=A0A3M7RDN0_BRAPC|nr:hypothetical protein BpHYR1_045774 [Brachionus plicatilis]
MSFETEKELSDVSCCLLMLSTQLLKFKFENNQPNLSVTERMQNQYKFRIQILKNLFIKLKVFIPLLLRAMELAVFLQMPLIESTYYRAREILLICDAVVKEVHTKQILKKFVGKIVFCGLRCDVLVGIGKEN